jgi:hypothetical protein
MPARPHRTAAGLAAVVPAAALSGVVLSAVAPAGALAQRAAPSLVGRVVDTAARPSPGRACR